ncbi:MAG: PEP-CTERM sorting domain-containing protein [Verrucomicrobia bacterium]|nr:PEP-CTERM sorting domain-containing protein [Verrucomicrobiota bacterium]
MDAKSISFFGSGLSLTVNDAFIPLIGDPRRGWVGDISGYAGQTVRLEFTTSTTPFLFLPEANLDHIAFSTEPIPEPESLLLVALAGIARFLRKNLRRPRPRDGSLSG